MLSSCEAVVIAVVYSDFISFDVYSFSVVDIAVVSPPSLPYMLFVWCAAAKDKKNRYVESTPVLANIQNVANSKS